MITPFTESSGVDYYGFSSNIKKWNEDKLAGYLVIGSNSETVYLNKEEKLELVRLTVQNVAAGHHIMVGSGMESARETITLTNKCAALGAHSALILTPNYCGGAMTPKALIRYYTTVADASDIPVLLYNVTKYTHVNLGADVIAELSKHPNIVGMKDSNGDVPQLANNLRVADPSFQILTGTFASWFSALGLGITATISAMANCCPNEAAEVQELYEAGKTDEARELYLRMLPVNAAVTGTYGIAGLKFACDYAGYTGGHVRNPLIDSSDEDKAKLTVILEKAVIRQPAIQ